MIQYVSKPFKWFFKLEAASDLFIGINNFGLKLSVHHWINDALMAVFFFFVTLEIKREFLQGELSNIKQALLPIIAAVGGMVVPAMFYVAINYGNAETINLFGRFECSLSKFNIG